MTRLICYCSISIANPDGSVPAELAGILLQSRRFNRRHSISGFLAYQSGWYLGVIEGGSEDVGALFDRIRSDPRHRNVRLILDDPDRRARLYKDWTLESSRGNSRSSAAIIFKSAYPESIRALDNSCRQKLEVFFSGKQQAYARQQRLRGDDAPPEFFLDALPLQLEVLTQLPRRLLILTPLLRDWQTVSDLVTISGQDKEFVSATIEHPIVRKALRKRIRQGRDSDATDAASGSLDSSERVNRSKFFAFFSKFF